MRRGPGRTPRPLEGVERERLRRAFLAAALLHELKQPLHSLNLNVELLGRRLDRAATDVGVAAPLAALGRAVDRISAGLDAYSALALPGPLPPGSVDLAALVAASAERAREQAERASVRVIVESEPLPLVPGSRLQLAIALDELLANAIRASRPGTSVTLRARKRVDDVQVEVVDVGLGMTPEGVRRAFEIGYSTWSGDGIGLTITKFIAYHHSGGLTVRGVPGEGTVVTLVLPLVSEGEGDEVADLRE